MGDPSAIPVLLESLATGGEVTRAAQDALASLPRKSVTTALLETLHGRPELRAGVIAVLIDLKCYDAIDPLVEIAANPDPAEYVPALNGLRGIADPDKADIPRLVQLLLRSEPGKHRDEVEKTILIVCDKLPAGADRAEPVLASLAKFDEAEKPKYLPVLGRLGGARSLAMIEAGLKDREPAVRESALRALCNWPSAEVAGRLWTFVTDSDNRAYHRMALRAYIRVVSLKSDRPASDTLAMLQNAFKLATTADDKRLAIERTSTVRTMDAVQWVASLLDDPQLAQSACKTIVELAHHRFLRHPNIKQFGPILQQVAKTSDDPTVVERAKRYRLGL
jgi:HEAT repeat protein